MQQKQGVGTLSPEVLDDGEDNEFFEPEHKSENPKVLKTIKKSSRFNWARG